jgi:hypothetical protein
LEITGSAGFLIVLFAVDPSHAVRALGSLFDVLGGGGVLVDLWGGPRN